MARVARLITEVFAPGVLAAVLPPVVAVHHGHLGWGLVVTLFTGVLPLLYVVRGVRRGRLTDHHIGLREQRRGPMLVGLACVGSALVVLLAFHGPQDLVALVVSMIAGVITTVLITHWWKISVHASVAAGTVLVLILVYGRGLILAVPLVGVVGWARVRLRDHTTAQVVAGAVVGALISGVVFSTLR